MRYFEVDTIVFTNQDNVSYEVKDIRQFPTDYIKVMSIQTGADDSLDEIACRRGIYGENSEMETYKIFEFNKVAIVESGFDMSKIRTLDIPA